MDGAFLSRFSNSGENKSASCLHCQILYVPTAFFVQYVPMKNIKKHTVVAISTLLTPIRVLLVGISSLSIMTLGFLMLGLFPTPVWIVLFPSMQEDASFLFPD